MKKMFFLSVFLLSAVQLSAQPEFFNDSLRKELGAFLVKTKQWENMYNKGEENPPGVYIENMITNTNVAQVPDTAQYGIYNFSVFLNSEFHNIFLKSKDQYEIIQIKYRKLEDILRDIIGYFNRHKEIDRKLLPDYIIAACKVYKNNESDWELVILSS